MIFFYGTLMTAFNRPGRHRIDHQLVGKGRGSIAAVLFDLGTYPGAIRDESHAGRVRGEAYEMADETAVLAVLDDIEGYCPDQPAASLYTRRLVPVSFDDGSVGDAWAYFYNLPLGAAVPIASGDYLEYLKTR